MTEQTVVEPTVPETDAKTGVKSGAKGKPRASRPVLAATAITGVTGAIALPLGKPGIGWLLVALVATTALLVIVTRSLRVFPKIKTGRLERVGWGVAALLLIAVGAIRDAGWLFVLCVLFAIATASLAVSAGRSPRAVAAGLFAVPLAAFVTPAWLVRGAATRPRKTGNRGYTLAISATALILLVFVPLLAGADSGFAGLLASATPEISPFGLAHWLLLFGLTGGLTAGAAYVLTTKAVPSRPAVPAKSVRRLEWALPVGTLTFLFATFVTSQLLRGGAQYVTGTAGVTYSGQARSGFWQLSLVTLLTLAVIAVANRWAPRKTRGDRLLLRLLLGALVLLTLVLVVSALSRMWTYQQAYGYTVLRVLVTFAELGLGVVYLLVLGAVLSLRAAWLPRAVTATAVAALLALAVVDPDRLIAERNIERWQQTGRIDLGYLSELSADAAPALDRLPSPHRERALWRLRYDYEPDSWREWNLSRSAARAVILR